MSQREVAIVGRNNTKAAVTGQEELLVKINSIGTAAFDELNTGIVKTPGILRVTDTNSIAAPVNSVSFANVGTANATVSADSGISFITIKPGETLTFDAGQNNYYSASVFRYNATTAGAELLIAYTY